MDNNKYVDCEHILKELKRANYIQMPSVLKLIENYGRVNGKDELFDRMKDMYYIKLKEYETDEI